MQPQGECLLCCDKFPKLIRAEQKRFRVNLTINYLKYSSRKRNNVIDLVHSDQILILILKLAVLGQIILFLNN